MICPHCGKELEIPENSERNMECYQNTVLTITKCCGKAVKAFPRFTYSAIIYDGDKKTDDWGREFK